VLVYRVLLHEGYIFRLRVYDTLECPSYVPIEEQMTVAGRIQLEELLEDQMQRVVGEVSFKGDHFLDFPLNGTSPVTAL